MKYLKNLRTLIVLFTSTLLTCNNTENSKKSQPEYVQEIDAFIRQVHDEGLFNGNILITKKDTIIYQESFGYSNASEKTKLSSASIFNIGSIAKEFNAVSIMLLVEQGKLSLDDYISKFELGLPEWSEKIKIRHLLNYAGGFPMPKDADFSNDDNALKSLKGIDSLLFEPGTNSEYNNYSVFIQQRIIEKVIKQTYKEFVMQNIVKPLGMTSAVFDPNSSHPNRTSCYGLDGNECPELEYISGWLWQDINDLYKWIDAMNKNKIISQKSFDTLFHDPFVKNATPSLGEYFESLELQRHNGGSIKYRSVFLNDFKNDIIIVMLSNKGSNVVRTSARLHNLMLGKPYRTIAEAIKEKCIEDIDLGIKAYYDLKSSSEAKMYPFDNPRELNRLAYELLRLKKIQEAIKIFQLEITEFPNGANGYDSLGEAYFVNKNYYLALKNYNKAIELGGTDGNAKKMIAKINEIRDQ